MNWKTKIILKLKFQIMIQKFIKIALAKKIRRLKMKSRYNQKFQNKNNKNKKNKFQPSIP
jgi:hypothetical protein